MEKGSLWKGLVFAVGSVGLAIVVLVLGVKTKIPEPAATSLVQVVSSAAPGGSSGEKEHIHLEKAPLSPPNMYDSTLYEVHVYLSPVVRGRRSDYPHQWQVWDRNQGRAIYWTPMDTVAVFK